jgi:hypothetical protein
MRSLRLVVVVASFGRELLSSSSRCLGAVAVGVANASARERFAAAAAALGEDKAPPLPTLLLLLLLLMVGRFWQLVHRQRPSSQCRPAAKQSQYSLTQRDFLQKHRGGGGGAALAPSSSTGDTASTSQPPKSALLAAGEHRTLACWSGMSSARATCVRGRKVRDLAARHLTTAACRCTDPKSFGALAQPRHAHPLLSSDPLGTQVLPAEKHSQ